MTEITISRSDEKATAILRAIRLIDEGAELEPVVRCKYCKHNVANKEHDPLDATDYTDIVCDYWMNDGNRPDDFCSYGERKDNG